MKHRTLLIFIVILSLLMIPVPAGASTIVADNMTNAQKHDQSKPILNVALTDMFNSLPDGHHDNFAGSQSPFFCRAEGWAADPDDRAADLNIRIFSDGVEIAQTVANTFRQDLADAGVCQDGTCSFSVSLSGLISSDADHLILVQAQDAQTGEWSTLYDTPKTLNCFTPQTQPFGVNSTTDNADANPGDSVCETFMPGECTLRAAITEANASPGLDTINFNIPGSGPHTISPSYELDFISDPVTIDGTTQPGFAGDPIIELDGSSAGPDAHGIFIFAGSSTVRGLVINRFAHTGIEIEVNGGNIIQGNYIGTDMTGTLALGNADDGVLLLAPNNTIGGTTLAARNIISGNQEQGIRMQGSEASGNIVQGNFIGVDRTGMVALGNGTDCCHSGIVLHLGASNNTIGGNIPGAGNVISGNTADGVTITDSGTSGNIVAGNLIGTNKTGDQGLGNSFAGVAMFGSTSDNRIGGTEAGAGNVISGNGASGIAIFDAGTIDNIIQGNSIGTDVTGMFDLGNFEDGIVIAGGSINTVGGLVGGSRNIISGNNGSGIVIINDGTNGNVVQGNFIGTDVNGTALLPNDSKGIAIFSGATNNRIGGTTSEARNIISGNRDNGIVIYGQGASANTVQGNYIGTDVSGTRALGNIGYGIFIGSAAVDNTIGGLTAGSRNLISGNSEHGIGIFDEGTTGNVVQGNYIGTDTSGTLPLGNFRSGIALGDALNNTVGGTAVKAGNLIAFNHESGVVFYNASGNAIFSNSIHSNIGLGIDLGDDGVTANDLTDADGGPNNLQNFPIIISVQRKNKGSEVHGTLLSTPNTSFRLEFFSNTTCDPTGYGEGETYLGFAEVKTRITGLTTFKILLPVPPMEGKFMTVTATDPAGNTSEFSPCIMVK